MVMLSLPTFYYSVTAAVVLWGLRFGVWDLWILPCFFEHFGLVPIKKVNLVHLLTFVPACLMRLKLTCWNAWNLLLVFLSTPTVCLFAWSEDEPPLWRDVMPMPWRTTCESKGKCSLNFQIKTLAEGTLLVRLGLSIARSRIISSSTYPNGMVILVKRGWYFVDGMWEMRSTVLPIITRTITSYLCFCPSQSVRFDTSWC